MGSVTAVFLAGVLAVAAVAKLRRPEATAAGMAALELPAVSVLSRAVPAAELVVAVMLLLAPGWGGVAAFALLAAFTVVLVATIRSGRVAPCRCFGATDDSPVSWAHVVRNVWLLALAATAATVSSLSLPSRSAAIGASAMLLVGPIAIGVAARRAKVTA